jgi:hypothetical protein
MSYTTRSIILVLFLTTILIVSSLSSMSTHKNEGFKTEDPLKELKKIPKFFKFLGKWFKWLGDIVKCAIETIIGLPNCFLFYMFDILIGTIALFIKMFCSFSPTLEKARKVTWKIVTKIDKMINKATGFRIIEYPKSIVKKCYKCKNKKMPTI